MSTYCRKGKGLQKAAKQGNNGSVGRQSTTGGRKKAEKHANWERVQPQVSTLDLGGLKPMDELSSTKNNNIFGFICFRAFERQGNSRFYFIPVHDLLPPPPKPRTWPSLVVTTSSPPPTQPPPPPPKEWSVDYTIRTKPKTRHFGGVTTTATAYPPPFVSQVLPEDITSRFSSAVFVYPRLYVMSSACQNNTDFYALDLSSGGGWKKLPSMTFVKVFPIAVSVKRNIYCFGSPDLTFGGSDGPFVDVYNVDRNRWTPVKANFILPFYSVGTLTVPLKDEDGGIHVLVYNENHGEHLCTYDIAKRCFTLLPEKSISSVEESQAAVVDGVLYCYELHEGQLVGYDLNSDVNVWTPILVSGFIEHVCRPVMRFHLVGIGNGMLCAISTYCDTGLLVCTFFKMLKKKTNKRNPPPTTTMTVVDHQQPTTTDVMMILEAHHVGTKVYAIPGHGEICDCLFV